MKSKIRWPRVLVEGVVIVSSILLAFAIDAGWSELQERREEQRLLENLRAEFLQSRETLSSAVELHRTRRQTAVALAEFGAGRSPELPSTFFPTIHISFLGHDTTHPETGVLDGILASGRLDLVESPELRSLLAGWPRKLGEFTEQETLIRDLTLQSRSAMAGSTPIADAVLTSGPMPSRDESASALSADVVRFLRSDVGRNYAALRSQLEALAIRDGEILLTGVDEVLAVLEREIR